MTVGIVLSLCGFIIAIIMTDNDFVQTDKLILAHSWVKISSFKENSENFFSLDYLL